MKIYETILTLIYMGICFILGLGFGIIFTIEILIKV